jgi:hypothetical protein
MPPISLPFSLELSSDWSLSTVILVGAVGEQPGSGGTERFSAKPFHQNLIVTMEAVKDTETAESYVPSQATPRISSHPTL